MECSPPGSSVHEIPQARILECVAIASSRASSRPRDRIWDSCISCIDKQILYHWASWVSSNWSYCLLIAKASQTSYIWHMRKMICVYVCCCCCSVVSDFLWPHGPQHTRLPGPSLSPGLCSDLCPLSQWCYPTISSSATLFSYCLQPFPCQGLFQWVSSAYSRINGWSCFYPEVTWPEGSGVPKSHRFASEGLLSATWMENFISSQAEGSRYSRR